jgi:hypothetical protein
MLEKVDGCSSAAPSVTQEAERLCLIQGESEDGISLNGDLNISDYLCDVSPTQKVVQDISVWTEKQRETTRTKLVLWLVKMLGCSLLGTFILTGAATFSPRADKELIRDLVPQLITTQVTLLGVAFGFYFSNKDD